MWRGRGLRAILQPATGGVIVMFLLKLVFYPSSPTNQGESVGSVRRASIPILAVAMLLMLLLTAANR